MMSLPVWLPGPMFLPGGLCLGGRIICIGEGSLPRRDLFQGDPPYGARAGGTHPTGMLSCLVVVFCFVGGYA